MNWKTVPLFVASAIFIAYMASTGAARQTTILESRFALTKAKGKGKACVNLAPGSVSHIFVGKGDDPFQAGTKAKVEDVTNNLKWAAEAVSITADKIELRLTKRAFTDLSAGAPTSGDLTITLTNPDGSAGPPVEPMPVQYTNDPPFRKEEGEISTRPQVRMKRID